MILDGVSSTSSTATEAASSQAKLEEDLNHFLNLLVTQLQNQDPLEPLDANEFTAQLVQFASVEQQIKQNSHLEELLAVQQNTQVGAMVNYLGKTIQALGNEMTLENGQAEFTYVLTENAADVTVTIQDASGDVVFSADGDMGAGSHVIQWDGKNASGVVQPDGTYKVTVTAFDKNGDLMEVEQTVFGRVTGASADGGDVTLLMGDVLVPLAEVLAVRETPTVTADAAGDGSGDDSTDSTTDGTGDTVTETETDEGV